MSNSWTIILIVGLAAAGLYLLLAQKNRSSSQHRAENSNVAQIEWQSLQRDHTKEREVSRLAHMSDDERAWETATLQRNRDNQARAAELMP